MSERKVSHGDTEPRSWLDLFSRSVKAVKASGAVQKIREARANNSAANEEETAPDAPQFGGRMFGGGGGGGSRIGGLALLTSPFFKNPTSTVSFQKHLQDISIQPLLPLPAEASLEAAHAAGEAPVQPVQPLDIA